MFEEYIPDLEKASRADRGLIIKNLMRSYGCSKDTVYRDLKKHGWSSGRKQRKDAGQTGVKDEALELLAAKLKSGIRADGRHTVEIPSARWALEKNGVDFGGRSNARLAELLRERGLDMKTLKTPASHQRMRSLHPNHVHFVDPSLCLVYYMPGGRQKIIAADEVYKNKPFLLGKEKYKVWRYVLTDHYSSSVCIRYYQADGEKMTNLWDFLLYAWSPKPNPQYLFHGVPEILIWDKGSANTAKAIKIALDSLEVKNIPHGTGNARAKGQVEKMNHLTELMFENHLKDDPAECVDDLNSWAEEFCCAYNANTIDGYDSTLKRAKTDRLSLWSRITREQLRELPDEARDLLVAEPQSRKVGGDLMIEYRHPRIKETCTYRVGGLEGVRVGLRVNVQPLMMDAGGAILLTWKYQGEEFQERLIPIEFDMVGFPVDAAVFGETFKSNKETFPERASKHLDKIIGDEKKPFAYFNDGRGMISVSDIKSRETTISHFPRIGTTINPGDVPDITINYVEAARLLNARLKHWDPAWLQVIQDNFPQGVPESKLDSLAETLSGLGGEHGNEVRFG